MAARFATKFNRFATSADCTVASMQQTQPDLNPDSPESYFAVVLRRRCVGALCVRRVGQARQPSLTHLLRVEDTLWSSRAQQLDHRRFEPAPDGFADIAEAACWVCSKRVARFESYGVPPRTGRCPHCGAKPRSRALHRLVRDRIGPRLRTGDRVLEIGPSHFSADHLIGGRHVRAGALRRRRRAAPAPSPVPRRLGPVRGGQRNDAPLHGRKLRLHPLQQHPALRGRGPPGARRDRPLPRAGGARDDRHPTAAPAPPAPRTHTGGSTPHSVRSGSPPTATPGSTARTSSTGCGGRGSIRWRSSCFPAPRPTSSPPTD